MTEAARQQECLNTLKTFNNTVVTIRLYPANAPQITNAIERGYKAVKQYLRQYGTFSLGLRGTEPELCGEILTQQVVQSISNLIVFRHLALLEAGSFVITPGLDRIKFKKILDIFSAKVDQIKEEGGGEPFIGRLGLDSFFTETDLGEKVETGKSSIVSEEQSPEAVEVRKECIDVLLGRERRDVIVSELKLLLTIPSAGAPVLAATILGVMDGMVQKKQYVTFSALEVVMNNCAKLIPADQQPALYSQTAAQLLKDISLPSLVLLISQQLKSQAGDMLIRSLHQQISIDLFGNVIRELRKIASKLEATQEGDSKQVKFIENAIDRLHGTPKGKLFEGQEKAKSIIQAGEKARRSRRVESGVKALLKGNDEVLQSEEFTSHLPFVLQRMEAEGMDREVNALLDILTKYSQNSAGKISEPTKKSLALIAEDLVMGKRWENLKKIAPPLIEWLKSSEKGDFVFEKISLALHALMSHSWKVQDFSLGDEILSVFYQIRSGTLVRSNAVRSIIGRTQDKGLDRQLMTQLLKQSLASPNDEVLSRRLILQGPIISRFLVDSLVQAEESKDRVKIIDLLTYGEQYLAPILVEKISEPMPWYGKRNLLKLLAETGSVEHLDVVYSFLHHEDLRVQREAFICLYKISGKMRKQALLKALNEAGETMKLQVVRALVPFGDADVAQSLSQLLEEHRFYSEELRDTLLSNACLAVARCPYPYSEKALLSFLEMRGQRGSRKIGSSVWESAETALNQVLENQQGERQLKAKAGQLRKSVLSKVNARKGSAERRLITGLAEERTIREFLAGGEKGKARIELLDLIGKIARLRRFTQAEQLREWLIEVDPLALTDIIRAAEIIEEEKHAAVDKGHLQIWSGLFDVLSTEEFSGFYHSLQHKRYINEELIVKKGATQTSLFFINSGTVKLFYRDKDRDILVKNMPSGQVMGVGSFFDASVWTISAAALGQVDLSILTFEKMQQWNEEFPALESKLHDFCLKFESVDDYFKQSEEHDRRQQKRYKVNNAPIGITLLDGVGKSTGVNSKGDLSDISKGGGSFYMRISKRDNARMLLGRNLRITLSSDELTGSPLSFAGLIVAVRAQRSADYEYSVHVEFSTILDDVQVQQILQVSSG